MRNQSINRIISNENEKQLVEKMNKFYEVIDKSYGEDRESYYSYIEELNKRKRQHWLAKRQIEKHIQSKIINDMKKKFTNVSLVEYDEIESDFLREHITVRNKRRNNELCMTKYNDEDYSAENYSIKAISIACLEGVC